MVESLASGFSLQECLEVMSSNEAIHVFRGTNDVHGAGAGIEQITVSMIWHTSGSDAIG